MREIMIRRNPGRKRRGGAGQSLVEFSLILFPLFFVLLGIIQFGFVFNTYVTMTNAARDAARLGTIYIYDADYSKDQNDLFRNEAIKEAVTTSMNMLGKTAPNFSLGGTWSQSGSTYTNVMTSSGRRLSAAASRTEVRTVWTSSQKPGAPKSKTVRARSIAAWLSNSRPSSRLSNARAVVSLPEPGAP